MGLVWEARSICACTEFGELGSRYVESVSFSVPAYTKVTARKSLSGRRTHPGLRRRGEVLSRSTADSWGSVMHNSGARAAGGTYLFLPNDGY
jgi:hypothetical protein